jgi:hypothetical protein
MNDTEKEIKVDSAKLIQFIRLFEDMPDATFEYENLSKFGTERVIRNYVREARLLGYPIAKADGGGYKYAQTFDEYKHTYFSERQHAFSIFAAHAKVLKRFKENNTLPASEEMAYRNLIKFLNEEGK